MAAIVSLTLSVDLPITLASTSRPLINLLATAFEATWELAAPLPGGESTPPTGLSQVDQSIVSLIATGVTDEVVAERLGLSVRTVRRRTHDLMQKVGAQSRFQFGVLAARRGWS